jgi:transcriptional regulator
MEEGSAGDRESSAAQAVMELRSIQWELSDIIRRLETLRANVSAVEALLSEELPEDQRRTGEL